MKVCLAFKVILNLNVMRSVAPTFLVFFRRKCASQESCRIRWVHFPCVFSGHPRLAFRSDCEFTCDAANCSLTPNTFPRKTRARSCDSQFFKTHVTPKGWDVKGGIPQNACWRLGCGEARQTLKHDRAIPKTTAVQGRTKEMQ